ncbi:MAG: hypothetical protein HQM10_13030 [Candidatus Riflebacteria bacterium]|nr:hypothetical protein [Candidatus Riflebacteria bacterium]
MGILSGNFRNVILSTGFSAMFLLVSGFSAQLSAQEADPFALPPESAPAGDPAAAPGAPAAPGAAAPAAPAAPTDDPFAGNAPAGTPSEAPAAAAPGGANLGESEQVEMIIQAAKFKLENEGKDPFRPLIQKKVKLPPPPPPMPRDNRGVVKPPPPPPPKPLNLTVQGICGDESERLAMVVFEGRPRTLLKGQQVDGQFKVVDILSDKVIVYSEKEQMRKTISIGGGKQ